MKALFVLGLIGFLGFAFPHGAEAVRQGPVEEVVYPSIVKIHPPAVHFAVSLPFLLFLLDLFYTLKRRSLDSLHFLATLLTTTAVAGAYVTGFIVHESIENLPIRSSAFEVLHTHETVGLIALIYFLGLFLLRVLLQFKESTFLRVLFSVGCFVGSLLIFFQGSLGGKLVYDFGVGVSK